jgi:hypothetical protein
MSDLRDDEIANSIGGYCLARFFDDGSIFLYDRTYSTESKSDVYDRAIANRKLYSSVGPQGAKRDDRTAWIRWYRRQGYRVVSVRLVLKGGPSRPPS